MKKQQPHSILIIGTGLEGKACLAAAMAISKTLEKIIIVNIEHDNAQASKDKIAQALDVTPEEVDKMLDLCTFNTTPSKQLLEILKEDELLKAVPIKKDLHTSSRPMDAILKNKKYK